MSPSTLCAFVAFGFGLTLNACAPAQPQVQPQPQLGPEPMQRGIFGPGDIGRARIDVAADSFWKPSLDEVRRTDAVLDSALTRAQTERSYNQPRDLPAYAVQYLGYVRDGHRRIFLNAACGGSPETERQWMAVDDGGACYFNVSYDIATGHLADLRFNGEA